MYENLVGDDDECMHVKLTFDDRNIEKVAFVRNNYNSGIDLEVKLPPSVQVFRKPKILSIDEESQQLQLSLNNNNSNNNNNNNNHNGYNDNNSNSHSGNRDQKPRQARAPRLDDNNNGGNGHILHKGNENSNNNNHSSSKSNQISGEGSLFAKSQSCPRLLISGVCKEKGCPFDHKISNQSMNEAFGNDSQLWRNKLYGKGNNNNNNHNNNNSNGSMNVNVTDIDNDSGGIGGGGFKHISTPMGWLPAAYSSFEIGLSSQYKYTLDKKTDELNDSDYYPWTFEIKEKNSSIHKSNDAASQSLHSMLKYLGQCWIFRIEFCHTV